MGKRILILSASAGAGHVRAAQALERAFAEVGSGDEVRHIDILQYTNPLFRTLYSKAYIEMVNTMPEVLGWLYDALDKPFKSRKRKQAFDRLNAMPVIRLLEQYQPDLAICTHFLPADIISWLKARKKKRLVTQQAIVITDFDVHAMWLCDHYEHYFVALDETRVHLEELGVPAAKIAVTGIPIDPAFAAPKDPRAMRKRLGLDPDKPTVLVSAGGFGVGRVDRVMDVLLRLRGPAQLVVICGRNEELKGQLDARSAEPGPDGRVALKVVGYTTAMDEFMVAADLLVGKPGGLTTSEAMARNLPMVIVNPIPGQEERNSDHLLEEGVAIRCNNLPTLAYKIDRLLADPDRLATMRANTRRIARPRAAFDVVGRVLAGAEAPMPPTPAGRP